MTAKELAEGLQVLVDGLRTMPETDRPAFPIVGKATVRGGGAEWIIVDTAETPPVVIREDN